MNFKLKTTLLLTAFIVSVSSEVIASESLSYSGRLVNTNGSPVTGPVDLKFDFVYTNATSTILCHQQITGVALTNGVFHVKLDPDCTPSSSNWLTVLSAIPAGEALAIRVTDETHTKAYSFQALHSMPLSTMSQISKQLAQLGATPGQVLAWDGSKWAPANESGTGNGSVTSVATGTGLTGGPITTSGTISIADGGVTDQKIAAGISRNKLAAGTASHVLVNDVSGAISSVAQLPVIQGGTGASTAAGARTNLGLGTAAVVDLGAGVGKAMPSDGVPVCFAFEKLQMTAGPAFAWACVPDNDSADNTKLPLDGSAAMTGALDMDNHLIMDVATPTAAGHAANKAYVDSLFGGVNSSQWLTNTTKIYYNSGNVGVGTADPLSKLHIVGNGRLDGRLEVGLSNGSTTVSTYGLHVGLDSGSNLAMFGDVQGSNGGVTITRPSDNGQLGIFDSWGVEKIRISTLADSYFNAGNLAIGNSAPGEKLDVTGNIALTGKVRMKSDNANYVELQAPSALAGTLNFKLPGTAGTTGQALITDGSGNLSWASVATGASAVGGDISGTVTSATINNGAVNSAKILDGSIVDVDVAAGAAIAQSKIANLTTDLAAKQPLITAGTTAQYWRGDKSWQTLDTGAVPEGSRLYFTEPRVLGTTLAGFSSGAGAITAADTVLSAFGKLDGNFNALSTSATTNFVNVTGDTMSGPLAMGNQNITGLAAPTANDHAATKAYVDTQVTGSSHWSKTGSAVHYDGGRVGIGTSTPGSKLTVAGATPEATQVSGDSAITLFGAGSAYFVGRDVTNDIEFTFGTSIDGEVFSGSMTTHDYTLRTNNLKRLTVKSDGKVGIGTNVPETSVQITHPRWGTGTTPQLGIKGSRAGIAFFDDNQAGANIFAIENGEQALSIFSTTHTADDWGFDEKVSRLTILGTSGNVGIGTATPAEKLDVAGNISLTGTLRLKSDTANYVVMRAPASLASTLTLTWPGTTGASGNALITDGAGNLSWSAVATTATSVGGDLTGSISNAQIAAGAIVDTDIAAGAAIAQSKIANLTTDLAAKQPLITAGTNAQYWRGDKTWQTLNTTAVPEGTNLYFLDSRVRTALMSGYAVGTAVPLAATDTLIEAIGKLEAQIIANDTAFDNSGVWTKSGVNVNYTAGKVSVGSTTTTQAKMNIGGTINGASRTWMDYGITFGAAADNDGGYIGLKDEGANRQDMVVAFGDDATDNLRFIHTRSAGALDGDEYMRITGTGLVGVGTSSPSAQLHLGKQEAVAGTTGSVERLAIQPYGHTGGPYRITARDVGAESFLDFKYAIYNLMTFKHTGRVGFGTTNPQAKVDISAGVDGQTGPVEALRISGPNSPADSNSAQDIRYKFASAGSSVIRSYRGSNWDTYLEFLTNPVTPNQDDPLVRMHISHNGNVGIGTTSPGSKLQVSINDNQDVVFGAQDGVNSNFRFLSKYTDGFSYIQTGINSSDTAAKLKFSRMGTNNSLADVRFMSDITSFTGNVGIGALTPGYPLSVYRQTTGTTVNYESGTAGAVAQTRYAGLTAGSVARVWGSGLNITNGNGGYEIYDYTASVSRMFINTSGSIGIGTVTPSYKLDVQGGNVNSSGAYTNTSDIRLKEEIKPLQNSLEKVVQLKPVSYYWKDRSFDPSLQIGLIAQEVEKVYPEVVKTDKKGMKTMSYPQLVSPIVDAIKELYSRWTIDHERIAKLEKENKALREQNEAILKRLDKLEQSRLPASK